MSELCLKITVESCVDIQCIPVVVGKGIDMSEQKKQFGAMLNVIIDGVAVSEDAEDRAEAGLEILRNLMPKYGHLVDKETIKKIESIIVMADKQESPTFRL
ncbi:TPA: hypothetical protein ACGVB5_004461 [Vibrio vulnificus]|nr:hypothetical protein [Vibrio vulnificus]